MKQKSEYTKGLSITLGGVIGLIVGSQIAGLVTGLAVGTAVAIAIGVVLDHDDTSAKKRTKKNK